MRTPYVELSAMSRVEAHRKNIYRPSYYVHKWWARRTGSVFRGLTLDLLLDGDTEVMDAYYRRHDFSDTVVLDPFMGGGTPVGEALRLGCNVVGCDLNPVAWFLVRQALRDADIEALQAAFGQVEAEVAHQIRGSYRTACPSCGDPAESQYVSWVKQVPCGECGTLADIHSSQVLMADMANKGAALAICPSCGDPEWVPDKTVSVACSTCSHAYVPSVRRSASTHYHCDECGHEDRILSAIGDGPPAHKMRCLTVWCESCGKNHKAPDQQDLKLYESISNRAIQEFEALSIPRQEIPPGHNTDQARRYGYTRWYEMFNARQLVGLSSLFEAIGRIEDEAARELLVLTASAGLEFNSMFCGAKGLGTGAIRHVFAHHAFIPTKEPLEANLWGVHRSSGGFSSLFRERLIRGQLWARNPVERRFSGTKAEKVPIVGERLAGKLADSFDDLADGEANLLLFNQSSEDLSQVPDDSVDFVITDPPYADSVMYSELSDYFYVWLREALGQSHPEFSETHVDDAREAVSNVSRGRDLDFYGEILTAVFREAHRTLKSGGRLAFTFHHSGEDAWESVQNALISSGFAVERWWPVFAEMESGVPIRGKANSGGHLDIVFVCADAESVLPRVEQDGPALMAARLSERVKLVAADERALWKADAVQAATWEARGSLEELAA